MPDTVYRMLYSGYRLRDRDVSGIAVDAGERATARGAWGNKGHVHTVSGGVLVSQQRKPYLDPTKTVPDAGRTL